MTLATSELIHPTAVIDPEATLAPDVQIGPYAIIEGAVEIGPECIIEAHASLTGPLTMGAENFIGHGAVLGKSPQHRGYRGEATSLRIGDRNVFREYVTIHRGTPDGRGLTSIGDCNMFMIGSHLGHDVQVGNSCTVVNNAQIGGHVILHDGCVISSQTAIQQRVRVGRLAMLGGMGSSTKDIPPFILQQGQNCVTGLNLIGMRRAGLSATAIDAMRRAFRLLYREAMTQSAALEQIESELGEVSEVAEFLGFIRDSKTGINPMRSWERANISMPMP
jgi:UDP-N-acetylglucosamine acyltransferase